MLAGQQAEKLFAEVVGDGFTREERSGADHGADFISADGRIIIELKVHSRGTRDLHAACVQLAMAVAERPRTVRAIVVVIAPGMSAGRVTTEWKRTQAALRRQLAERLALVAVTTDGDVMLPAEDPVLRRLRAAANAVFKAVSPSMVARATSGWTQKPFEVWRVLLDSWLRNEGPLSMRDLAARAACSHPTVIATITRLHALGEIERARRRSAMLARFPRESLAQLFPMLDALRGTMRFVDASGREPDPALLARRIATKAPSNVALGGVVSARHFDPRFDLNGTPRVDVTVFGPDPDGWVRSVDPALRHAGPGQPGVVLVVHQLHRGAPRFVESSDPRTRYADPAETVLDLHDMRLLEQADNLVRHLRTA